MKYFELLEKVNFSQRVTGRVIIKNLDHKVPNGWAVMIDGKPFMTNLTKHQLKFYKNMAYWNIQVGVPNGIY